MLVAGFQGVSTAKDVTTLGRGGSDTTAVALAAAIGAEVCEIYTDVPGVFSADPRIVPDARKLRSCRSRRCSRWRHRARACCSCAAWSTRATTASASTADLASTTAPVPLSSRAGDHGTPPHHRRHPLDRGGARHAHGRARHARRRGRISTALADANVNVDMIIQNEPVTEGARADMSFTVPREDLRARARRARAARRPSWGSTDRTDEAMGKVSIVGAGMKTTGRRREGLHDARRARHQHRDDLHLADQDLLRNRGRARARRRARAAQRI